MFKSLFSRFSRRSHPLTGAPAVRRLKTYSAQSGYTYQYFYEGHRDFESRAEHGLEFVFQASADRKTWRPVSVFLAREAVAAWEREHGRALSSTERYALAKMALFQAFDERTAPEQMKAPVRLRAADVESILSGLGLD